MDPHVDHQAAAPGRRAFLRGTALAGAAAVFAPAGARAQAAPQYGTSDFAYEVVKSESEWRAQLGEDAYKILREGATEFPTTSALWNDYRAGEFFCRGCDLPLYTSNWRAPIEQGWVFFYHAHTDAVLTGVDRGNPYSGRQPDAEDVFEPRRALIEVHCRRCGGHLGHIVYVEKSLVHCINGQALRFDPAAT